GVRWSRPFASIGAHASGDQAAAATVRGRAETLRVPVVNLAGLSAACPSMRSVVAMLPVLATWSCTQAARIGAPRGTASSGKRSPTVWRVVSWTSSSVLLVRVTFPAADSSASSALVAMRTSTVRRMSGTVLAVVLVVVTVVNAVPAVRLVDVDVLVVV